MLFLSRRKDVEARDRAGEGKMHGISSFPFRIEVSNAYLQSSIWIPGETFGDKVDEELIVALENGLQCLSSWSSPPSFAVDCRSGSTSRIEEELFARAAVDDMLVGDA